MKLRGLSISKEKNVTQLLELVSQIISFLYFRKMEVKLIPKPFPDHYAFSEKDLAFNENHPIIMTSKDCVKCVSFATEQMWYLSVSAKINSNFYQQLESKF